MSVVLHARYLTVLSEMVDHLSRKAKGVGPTQLRNRNSESDHQKIIGVSRE